MKAGKELNKKTNWAHLSISGGRKCAEGDKGFGVPYKSISKGKYMPTKNGGK